MRKVIFNNVTPAWQVTFVNILAVGNPVGTVTAGIR